jgi:hypothetical protein
MDDEAIVIKSYRWSGDGAQPETVTIGMGPTIVLHVEKSNNKGN